MSAQRCKRSWLHKIGAVYSKHAGLSSTTCTFLEQCPNTSTKSHAHLQCVHNTSAKFEECQPKGVRGVDYTK
jgi:hypothetical protein